VGQPIIIWLGNIGPGAVNVDNVVLTVPEPASAVLLIAMVGVVGLRPRRMSRVNQRERTCLKTPRGIMSKQ
jgi:hypothetical protein